MCFERNLGATETVALIKQLFEIFLQMRIRQSIKGNVVYFDFLRMDVKLLKEGSGYTVQVSNCGKWKIELCDRIMNEMHQFCAKLILKTENNLLQGEIVYKEYQVPSIQLSSVQDINEFPHLKEYISVKMKPIIHFCNLKAFEEALLKEISSLNMLNPEVKFTYFRDSIILYNNNVELDQDYKYCSIVSSAMYNVVKLSLREEFRHECLQLFSVTNVEDLNLAIKSILLQKLHSNYVNMTFQILRDFQGAEKYF